MAEDWAWSAMRGWFRLDGQQDEGQQTSQDPDDPGEREEWQWQSHQYHDDGWWGNATGQWQWQSEHRGWEQPWGSTWQSWDWSDQRRSWNDQDWHGGWNQDAWSHPDSASASHRVSAGDDGEAHRRDSLPTTVETAPKENGDGGSVNGSQQSSKPREPKTGKEIIPSFDGSTPLRDYRRRVQLFLSTTGIDPEFRAGRLVEQMTGVAWKTTETLQMDRLRSPQGVEYLLEHLQAELEPVEHLQVFGTLQQFFKSFRRARGEEFVTYDMNFRSQMQKLEEIDAGLHGIVKSWWFLECAGLSQELRKQVITASGGSYKYERLREALVAIVPTVKREGQEEQPNSQVPTGKKTFFSKKIINKVNMVDEQDDGPLQDEEDSRQPEHAEGEDEADIEELERQAQVLMTQASKRRAKVEQNRGFQRQETAEQRDARIKEMKNRMCCSACKAHGKTVFGHWHGDPICPYYGQQGKPSNKEEGKGVFVVTQAGEELEGTSDDEAFMVNVSTVFHTMNSDPEVDLSRLALSDTCCARTVSGENWMRSFMLKMWSKGI